MVHDKLYCVIAIENTFHHSFYTSSMAPVVSTSNEPINLFRNIELFELTWGNVTTKGSNFYNEISMKWRIRVLCNVQENTFVWEWTVLCTCYIRYILNKCMHRSIRLAIKYSHIGNQIFKYVVGQLYCLSWSHECVIVSRNRTKITFIYLYYNLQLFESSMCQRNGRETSYLR
jgi:hypothetical protein